MQLAKNKIKIRKLSNKYLKKMKQLLFPSNI